MVSLLVLNSVIIRTSLDAVLTVSLILDINVCLHWLEILRVELPVGIELRIMVKNVTMGIKQDARNVSYNLDTSVTIM